MNKGRQENPLYHAFVEAGRQAGYETTADYNGLKQEGFAAFEHTIHKGRRWSAASAYLKPAIKRGGVQVIRGFARRVVMEGKTAIGVEISRGRPRRKS